MYNEENDTIDSFVVPRCYLTDGYYASTESGEIYIRKEYIDDYACSIAYALEDMNPSDFYNLLRGLKSSKNSALPFAARESAVAELLLKSMRLVRKKKAPYLLVDFVQSNQLVIKCERDYDGFLLHFEAIYEYMSLFNLE